MSRVATYSGPFERNLHGLGGLGMAICLDQSQNTIACMDPNCTYGDCGSSDTQLVGGALCLDQSENQVPCSNPECTYGDCLPSTRAPSTFGMPNWAVLGVGVILAGALVSGMGGGRRR
jgi:hypothetical protein